MSELNTLNGIFAIPIEWNNYKFSPLTMNQIIRLQNEACNYPLERAKIQIDKLGDVLNTDDKLLLINRAEERCRELKNPASFFSNKEDIEKCNNEINDWISSPDGVYYLISLSLQKFHPDLNEEEIKNIINTVEDAEKLTDIMTELLERTHGEKKTVKKNTVKRRSGKKY